MRESGRPSASARPLRMRWGDCDDAQTVSVPSTGSTAAITPRDSIGADEQRPWRNVSAMRMSAAASACATGPCSKRVWNTMLSGSSSCSRGASARMLASASATAGKDS